jgi:glutathione synthase/RimK-type ligase-like ATP-grasp enzyme
MWHFHHAGARDILFAKSLLYSLQSCGIRTFPDFDTVWHFDDKIAQKYLFESHDLPLVKTTVFYEKEKALEWINSTTFPKVFKLRGGAGSSNVRLVKNRRSGRKLIKKAFGHGFSQYNAFDSLKERWRKYKLGKTTFFDVVKGFARIFSPTRFAKIAGREMGYAYFQDFIPDNDHDVRVVVVANKAFAIKRMTRKNDFRASGSGHILYDRALIDVETVRLAFLMSKKLKTQCAAFDFVNNHGKWMAVEVSYGFSKEGYDPCPGYWDQELRWHEGKFNPYGWMVDLVIDK